MGVYDKRTCLFLLETRIKEGYETIDNLKSLGLGDTNEVRDLDNLLKKCSQDYVANWEKRTITKKIISEASDSIKKEIFKISLYPIKVLDITELEKEDGLYIATVVVEDCDILKIYSANSLIGLKHKIINDVDVNKIKSLSCNDVYYDDIKKFFKCSQDELQVNSIKHDNMTELRDFLKKHRDNQLNFLKDEYINRHKELSVYTRKFFNIPPNKNGGDYWNYRVKSEYRATHSAMIYKENYNINTEYARHTNYIKNEYWKNRNLSAKFQKIIDKNDLTYIYDLLEKQYCDEFKKIKDTIEQYGGAINDIYDVYIGAKGDLNYIADCERALVNVRTIGAGGYNIQIFHYRTITSIKKIKDIDEIENKGFSKKDKELFESFIPTIKDAVLNGYLTMEEAFILNGGCRRFYKDFDKYRDWGQDLDFYMFIGHISDEDYKDNLAKFKKVYRSLQKKKYITVEVEKLSFSSKIEYTINFDIKSTGVGGILGFTEEDFKKYNYSIEYA